MSIASHGDAVAGAQVADADAERCGLREEGAVGRGVGVDADPELAGAEVAQHGGHAAHVVGVGVGEGDDVEAADAGATRGRARRPLRRRRRWLSWRRRFRRCGGAGGAAGVDEHGAAGGADDEQGVALADVDGGDFELAGMDGRRRGPEGDRGGERKERDGGQCEARAIGGRPSSRRRCRRARASACAKRGAGDAEVGGLAWLTRLDGAR